jgi:hypothetical protein
MPKLSAARSIMCGLPPCGRFVHILSQTDIIPRCLIAPKAMIESLLASSIDTYWAALLFQTPFWIVGEISSACACNVHALVLCLLCDAS